MTDATTQARTRRARRILLLIGLVVAAPVVLAYAFYRFAPPTRLANYGELLPTVPVAAVRGARSDGVPFDLALERGRWNVVVATPGRCDARCAQALYATRQARTMQGRDRERVRRVWLVDEHSRPDRALLAEHPDLVLVRTTAAQVSALPRGPDAIYLVDPVGHQVLAWPLDPDIRALARDLTRLLKASRIG